jgi:hypothetical protein
MSATSPKATPSDTAYPSAARDRETQGPRNWEAGGIVWAEDALFAWRGVVAFGGLLFVLGMLYWLGATGYDGYTLGPLIALFAFCFLGAAFVAFLGLSEIALAFLGTAVVTGAIALLDPPYLIPTPGALFSSPSTAGADLSTVLALWVVGGVLMLAGGFGTVQTSREIDSEE